PLVPPELKQPTLQLPWQQGLTWYLTGGPHGGWADGSAWAAIDFAPGENAGTCQPSPEYAAAAAPGLVVQAEDGRVMVNLEGKNFQGVGWTVMYMHMSATGRVAIGSRVNTGDSIGRPSCEGGYSEADHLHFARLYNGQWLAAADRKIPMVISGWKVIGGGSQYDGSIVRGAQVIDACNCNSISVNGVPWSSAVAGAGSAGSVVENAPPGRSVETAAAASGTGGSPQKGGGGPTSASPEP
ncbi:MAG: M23 family metallopeptidase, partial [Rudaea sp.]